MIAFDVARQIVKRPTRRDAEKQTTSRPDVFRDVRPIAAPLVVLAGAQVLDHIDLSLLTGAFRALERTLGPSASELAHITVAGKLSGAFGSPFWGVLSDRYDRRVVLALGCFSWGATTLLLGCVSSLSALIAVRVLNGIALSSMTPIVQGVVADMTAPQYRGTAFGIFGAIGDAGNIIAMMMVPTMSNRQLFGIAGWRCTCYLFALTSALYSIIVITCLRELNSGFRNGEPVLQSALSGMKTIFRTKTWLLICFQGIFGAMPYATFGFIILWLQYLGFSDFAAGFIVSFQSMGSFAGTLCAGVFGDWAAASSPNHGRIFTAQAADLFRVPLLLVLFLVLPHAAAGVPTYAMLIASLGFFQPFPSIACSKPVLAEIVQPQLRSSIIAYQALIENSLGSLGAIAVGHLAENCFQYQSSKDAVALMPDAVREQNARALGLALAVTTSVPWSLCTILYGLVHFTYKYDRETALRSGVQD